MDGGLACAACGYKAARGYIVRTHLLPFHSTPTTATTLHLPFSHRPVPFIGPSSPSLPFSLARREEKRGGAGICPCLPSGFFASRPGPLRRRPPWVDSRRSRMKPSIWWGITACWLPLPLLLLPILLFCLRRLDSDCNISSTSTFVRRFWLLD